LAAAVDTNAMLRFLVSLRSLAEVRLNGQDLGTLWCLPWRVEVTGILNPTANTLEIDIIDLWANRLIGDIELPADEQASWSSVGDTISALKPDSRLVPSGLYGPVTLSIEAT
jgi:hypothetical protein